jgi:hypothetical protein
MDRNTCPADGTAVFLSQGPDAKAIFSDCTVLPAGSCVRVVHRCATTKDFSEHSKLHFRPFPAEVAAGLAGLLDRTGGEGMSVDMLEMLMCILHWKLRVCECLVSRIVNAISSSPSKIAAINKVWKAHGIHAVISKAEKSSTWGVHGVDGDSADKICGFWASWLPDQVLTWCLVIACIGCGAYQLRCMQVNPLVKVLWETFHKLVVSLHKPPPVPADCSSYVDIDMFAQTVHTFAARQARLKYLFHLCYDDQTFAVYIHAGCDHMPLYFAYHMTLNGLSQAPLEYFHNITRNLQLMTFHKSPLETFKQEGRRVFAEAHEYVPRCVYAAAAEYADYGQVELKAQKALSDANANVRPPE